MTRDEDGNTTAPAPEPPPPPYERPRDPRPLPELYSCHHGTVARVQPFGAFVAIEGHCDGMVHISQLRNGDRVENVTDVVNQGDKVMVFFKSWLFISATQIQR